MISSVHSRPESPCIAAMRKAKMSMTPSSFTPAACVTKLSSKCEFSPMSNLKKVAMSRNSGKGSCQKHYLPTNFSKGISGPSTNMRTTGRQ